MPCGPSASTRSASAAVGAMPSAVTSRASSLSSSGLPCVALRHARTKAASASAPIRAASSRPTASPLSGRGRSDLARRVGDELRERGPGVLVDRPGGDEQRRPASPRSAARGSRGTAATARPPTARRRRRSASGPSSDRLAVSQYSPCRRWKAASSPTAVSADAVGSNIAPASAAAPESQRARSSGAAWWSTGSKQLAHDAEREPGLELGPARVQQPEAAAARVRLRAAQQARLAEPAGRLQHDERAGAALHPRQRVRERPSPPHPAPVAPHRIMIGRCARRSSETESAHGSRPRSTARSAAKARSC